MRIAVTYENGMVFGHFGHTSEFKIYETEDGRILSSEVIGTNGSGHGALAELLARQKIDLLICGGIGGGAQLALAAEGIALCGGVIGEADRAVLDYLAGKLAYDPHAKCDHHGEHHHDHDCGSHGCGSHDCGHHH